MKCTDRLGREHKVILRALDVLAEMARRVENHKTLEHDDVESLLRFLRSFADDYHQLKEESALFPELRRVLRVPKGPVEQMLFEHDQERSLVEGIEDALFTKKGPVFVHLARRLIDLLRDHVRKEDHVLFDIVRRSLSPEQDESIATEFEKFSFDPASMSEFRNLEWKYMRRVA